MKRRDFLKYGSTGVAFITLGGLKIPFLKAGDASACGMGAAWKFGVLSDTQWTVADDGKNPNTCAADIIRQVNKQFISQKVDLVIAVGDTVNTGSRANISVRALYAQELYNHGIGFYPLRGNHEVVEGIGLDGKSPDLTSGFELAHAFPQTGSATADAPQYQTGNGLNNDTPPDITAALVSPQVDLAGNPPAEARGLPFRIGHNFSAPVDVNTTHRSVSYSFDYNDARFILLDQFNKDGDYYLSTVPEQQEWISEQLADCRRPHHAFVFTHKNLLGGNHKDNMFGGQVSSADPGDGYGIDPASLTASDAAVLEQKQQAEDAFISSLADNNVRFCISGHDHHHYHSIVTSPLNPDKSIHQLITQSDSSKFYTPTAPFSANDLPVSQDLYRVGYYIVTIEGPSITIDYYGSQVFSSAGLPGGTTPALIFTKLDSFGYSLNGREFHVAKGESYTVVQDRFEKTAARILDGTNGSQGQTNTHRALAKIVNIGWTRDTNNAVVSDILTLQGMTDLGTPNTDSYVLSMTCGKLHGNGEYGIVSRNGNGNWADASDMNNGGTKRFVSGPWKAGYALGTYGVDSGTGTAWAVINYEGDFAVAWTSKPSRGRK